MRISKNHLGIAFEIWNAHQSWFSLITRIRTITIGAAATSLTRCATLAHRSKRSPIQIRAPDGSVRSEISHAISLRSAIRPREFGQKKI